MTDRERERLQRGLMVLQDRPEYMAAIQLARGVVQLLVGCKDEAYADQLRRAVWSVPANTCEAWGRCRPNQVVQYLLVARGSLWEVLGLLYCSPGLEVGTLVEQVGTLAKHIDNAIMSLLMEATV